MIELKDVEAARQRIDDYVYYSPLARSETLSQISGAPLYLKLENLQMTGSFKDRGPLIGCCSSARRTERVGW